MAYLNYKKLKQKVRALNLPYWNEGYRYRWEYMSAVIEIMKKCGNNTLECGAYFMPLNDTSYQIELEKRFLVTGRGIIRDLNEIPYPIPDKNFDCAVALQV